jgi:hypothetical protein
MCQMQINKYIDMEYNICNMIGLATATLYERTWEGNIFQRVELANTHYFI